MAGSEAQSLFIQFFTYSSHIYALNVLTQERLSKDMAFGVEMSNYLSELRLNSVFRGIKVWFLRKIDTLKLLIHLRISKRLIAPQSPSKSIFKLNHE